MKQGWAVLLALCGACATPGPDAAEIGPSEGQFAPDFSVPAQDGVVHSLHDYEGRWVVLYFFPKAGTPG